MSTDDSVSQVTRRNIIDAIIVGKISWAGRMTDAEFLSRLFNLNRLPSTDYRYSTAARDIWQHTENNHDWEDDWVFHDHRFNLFHGPDEQFLRFLCEMAHPLVQSDPEVVSSLIDLFNQHLAADGWMIAPSNEISGKPVFSAQRRIEVASPVIEQVRQMADALSASYISQQITRMQVAVATDPELAIGTAKELIETICKTILRARNVSVANADIPQLVKLTFRELRLVSDTVQDATKASEILRVLTNNLGSIIKGLAELRNIHGSGHGKDGNFTGLEQRHARLAVGVAAALSAFLYETLQATPATATSL